MSAGEQGNGAYLSSGEVARLLDVSPRTVCRWADKGLIPYVVTTGGHRRFRAGAVESIRRQMSGPPPAAAPEIDEEQT